MRSRGSNLFFCCVKKVNIFHHSQPNYFSPSPDLPGVVVLNGAEDLLGLLPQVGGQLEAVDPAGGVAHHEDRLLGVEGDLVEAALARGDHFLSINNKWSGNFNC